MPGVDPGSLNIELIDNSLFIEGNKESDVQKDTYYIRKERQFGAFKKSVKLPYRVDPDSVNAGLRNGILTVKLSKSEKAKPRKIETSVEK